MVTWQYLIDQSAHMIGLDNGTRFVRDHLLVHTVPVATKQKFHPQAGPRLVRSAYSLFPLRGSDWRGTGQEIHRE